MEMNPLVFETSASTDSAIWACRKDGAKVRIVSSLTNFSDVFLLLLLPVIHLIKKLNLMSQQIIKCRNLTEDLRKALQSIVYDKLFILADENTSRLCMPLLTGIPEILNAPLFIIKAGDVNKNIETLSIVWKFLCDNGATRKSLLLNL